MTRLINRHISPPVVNQHGDPLRFSWAGRTYEVLEVLDCWRDVGTWWEGEPEKTFWRVRTTDGGLFELWQDRNGRWALYRVWD